MHLRDPVLYRIAAGAEHYRASATGRHTSVYPMCAMRTSTATAPLGILTSCFQKLAGLTSNLCAVMAYIRYDLAHPFGDYVERITHSLCTMEFDEHRPVPLLSWMPLQIPHCRAALLERHR